MLKGKLKTFGEVMPKIEFHPDLPKVELKSLMDMEIEVTDAMIVRDFNSKFGSSDFALLLITNQADGTQYTTLCGGMVVVKKLQYALDNRLLPLRGTITKDVDYYDIN
ncbi:hypothetical protein ES703_121018 [subsurface metagenome]